MATNRIPYDLLAELQTNAEMLGLLLTPRDHGEPSAWLLNALQREVARLTGRAHREVEHEFAKATDPEKHGPYGAIGDYEELAHGFLVLMAQINALAHIPWYDPNAGGYWSDPDMRVSPSEYYNAAVSLAAGLKPYVGIYDRAEAAERDGVAA